MVTKDEEITLQDLYPNLSAEQQAEAAAHLARYVEVICRIYERNQDLTEVDQAATI